MSIITLLSDWGTKDHYVASVKGRIYTYLPEATIVDISHEIPFFDLGKAAHVLKNSYFNFPKGSIHIIGVNAVASINMPHVIVEYEQHYFIGADNGIFSLLFPEIPQNVWEVNVMQDSLSYTFPCRDVFPKVAAKIAHKEDFANFTYHSQIKNILTPNMPAYSHNTDAEGNLIDGFIRGIVVYIDHYGNLITNIPRYRFDEFHANFSKFELTLGRETFHKLSQAYQDVSMGDLVALFGADDMLQIAICQGPASSLLNIKINEY
ncbi:MAG: SAM-dependent chlorinase/fluorinase, partial [Bacteroidales bacterium]